MVTTSSRTGTHRLMKGRTIQLLMGLLMAFVAIGATQVPAAAAQASTLRASAVQASAVQASAVQAQQVAALAALAAQSARIPQRASWTCNWYRSGNNVDSYCSVYSGYLRQWAYCAGWGYIYTGWVGVGYSHLWTYCNGYPMTAWGYQSVG
jgi:hypothetical protein